MKMYQHLPRGSSIIPSILLLALFLCLSHTSNAQEVRDAAAARGIKFGSPLFNLQDPVNRQLYRDNVAVGTVPTYWKYTTRINEGSPNFTESDAAVQFAEQNGWDVHGHPLVWGSDVHIPDWVLNKPLNQAEELMIDHIRQVAGHYAGRIDIWDVVNEAIEDDGTYRNSYWNRAMTGEYILKAFREARSVDPNAILIYNDYGIESNFAKFETVKGLLGWMQWAGVHVDGLGWQLHIRNPDEVLDPNFPLEQRMREISDMGLSNYVTELDIRIPENSGYWLERQKQAYKKIAEIFLRNPTRGEYFQTWDLSDTYTWYDQNNNEYDPEGRIDHPLPFDRNNNKKPAYWGLYEAFADIVENRYVGELRIKNLWSNTYLHQAENFSGGEVALHSLQSGWFSQRWNFEEADAGTYRLRCSWGSNYLNSTANFNDATVNVTSYDPSFWSEMWFVEDAGNGLFRLRNRWTSKYLHTPNQFSLSTHDLNPDWWSQLWVFEYIDGRNVRLAEEAVELLISPNPTTSTIQIMGINTPLHYQIYDTAGRVVISGEGQTMDVSTLANGTYLLVAFLKNEDGTERFARGIFIKK